jgi:phosphoribosylaminoimidazole-succinocarboxamide synthase
MHDIKLPEGLKESTRFEPALFTPSTKAEVGDKDINIHPDERTCSFLALCRAQETILASLECVLIAEGRH